MRVSLMVPLLMCLGGADARGATLHVPSQYPTIQAAVNAAAQYGDVILVDQGDYLEDVVVPEKTVDITSEHGAAQTTVSSLTFTAQFPYSETGGSVTGFTIRETLDAGDVSAFQLTQCDTRGAVHIWSDAMFGPVIDVVSCSLRAGVSLSCRGQIDVSTCVIFNAPLTLSNAYDARVTRCRVERTDVYVDGQTASISSCVLDGARAEIHALVSGYAGGNTLTTGLLTVDVTQPYTGGAEVETNCIWNGGILLRADATHSLIATSNTVYGYGGAGIWIETPRDVDLERNIVASCSRGVVFALHPGSVHLACNDVWNNTENWVGVGDPTGFNGNIRLDPRFCDPGGAILTLASDSPCLPGHPQNHDCGQIGARGQGCELPAAVEDDVPAPGWEPALALVMPNPYHAGGPILLRSLMPEAQAHGEAVVTVYDCLGRQVRTLWRGSPGEGERRFSWDGRGEGGNAAPGGLYLLRVETAERVITDKFILAR